jgi:hypothetical protein
MDADWSGEELFSWFVIQQQQVAMIHLGKMVHPATHKIERDLDAARFSIDLLGMLEAKSKGNLTADEERLLGQVLATLRLNYVEEAQRGPSEAESAAPPEAKGAEAEGGSADAAGQ